MSSLSDKDWNPPINNSLREVWNAPTNTNQGAIYTITQSVRQTIKLSYHNDKHLLLKKHSGYHLVLRQMYKWLFPNSETFKEYACIF